MKKLAVLFPGIGYTNDKPLMYYSRRIAGEHDYEILPIAYSGFPKKVKGDRKRMEESFSIALTQAEQRLAEVDLCSYDDVLFIGKSIGTIVAAKIASESPAKEKIRLVLYTPLPDTFSFPFGKAIAFTGTDDPWVGKEKNPVYGICEEKGIPCTLISYANHSLESHDSFQDMKELYRIMRETERFIMRDKENHEGKIVLPKEK
jgi:phosphoglycolate phosphatase